jgi:hypothetical protein
MDRPNRLVWGVRRLGVADLVGVHHPPFWSPVTRVGRCLFLAACHPCPRCFLPSRSLLLHIAPTSRVGPHAPSLIEHPDPTIQM